MCTTDENWVIFRTFSAIYLESLHIMNFLASNVLKKEDSIWLHVEDATILAVSKNRHHTMLNINIFFVKQTKRSLSDNFPTFLSFVLKAILNLPSEQIPKTLNYDSSLIISKTFI